MAGSGPLTDEIGAQLAGWGVVAHLTTTGRRTGAPVTTAIGYVEEPDGSLLVAAGDPDADWARNLEADAHCRIAIAGREEAMLAEPLEGAAAARAIGALILRYGTPAERLGRGPAFRLRRTASRPSR